MQESLRIDWYGELPQAKEWVTARGGLMVYGQNDPGPAMGYIGTPDGIAEVHIGHTIHFVQGRGFRVE